MHIDMWESVNCALHKSQVSMLSPTVVVQFLWNVVKTFRLNRMKIHKCEAISFAFDHSIFISIHLFWTVWSTLVYAYIDLFFICILLSFFGPTHIPCEHSRDMFWKWEWHKFFYSLVCVVVCIAVECASFSSILSPCLFFVVYLKI